ncbi:rod shape-determining protein [bacterium]|nr:rod shape-determining protein [Candidatus Brocadiia bacterium]NQT54292.1 rod shape-determining protein [bacterium]
MYLLDRVWSLFSLDMGIDLGTANTLVCLRGKGIVLSEPSVVAVKKGTTKVLLDGKAVGQMAKDMLGRVPGNIEAIRPMKNGVIANFDITERMLRYFIRKAHGRQWGCRPRLVIAVPSGITDVEKRAVFASADRAGARKVYLIDEPKAAGIGAGMPITNPTGNMIVDIGGGTTEVAVISLGGVVTSQSLRIAGDRMDEAIVQHMKRTYNMDIGPRMAEDIKIDIGSAFAQDEELTAEAKGRDFITGLPRREIITSEEVREALREPVSAIIESIRLTLEKTPPELSADIFDRGMMIAGGGALLRGLDKAISRETGLQVTIADDPLTCVARGTGTVLDDLSRMSGVLEGSESDY